MAADRKGIATIVIGVVLLAGCTAADERRRLGDICDKGEQCSSGRCDELVCKSGDPLGADDGCEHPLQCRSERCVEGACAAIGIRDGGAPCSEDLQCASAQCVDGRCSRIVVRGWPRRFGGSGVDLVADLAVDAAGQLYLVAEISDEADFGGETLQATGTVLASYAADGAHRWSRAFEGVRATGLAVGAGGETAIVGEFWHPSVDLGGGALINAGNGDIFVASYATDGEHRWSKGFGGLTSEKATSVVIDSQGHVVVGGQFGGDRLDFGGEPLLLVPPSNEGDVVMNTDLFLVSFTAAGDHRWSQSFGTSATDRTNDLAISNDIIYVTGNGGSDLDFGGGALGVGGLFVASFDTDGAYRWATGFGSVGFDDGWSLATDATGSVYLAGSFAGETLDLGGGGLTNPGLLSSFAALFDADGTHLQSTIIGQVSQGARITTDAEGNVIVFGAFRGEVDLGGDPLVAAGGRDGFVLGLTTDLTHGWSRRYGGERDDLVSEVVVGSKGDLYFAGSFGEVIDLDGTKLTSTGSLDLFLSRLVVP